MQVASRVVTCEFRLKFVTVCARVNATFRVVTRSDGGWSMRAALFKSESMIVISARRLSERCSSHGRRLGGGVHLRLTGFKKNSKIRGIIKKNCF